jgi:hypothetical protein
MQICFSHAQQAMKLVFCLKNLKYFIFKHTLLRPAHYNSTNMKCKLTTSFIKQQHAYKLCGAESDFLQLGEAMAVSALAGGGLPGEGTEGEGNTTAIAAAGRAPKFL